MTSVPQSRQECRNLLLGMLPDDEYQRLLPDLEYIATPLHFKLFERDGPIRHAYFPLSGEHSILAIMENGATIEVGTVGYEGFSTIDLLTGNEIGITTTVCQIPGEALRMTSDRFFALTAGDTPLRKLCLQYLQAYLAQVSQSVACNALHSVEQRFARWILMSHDRMHHASFQLTHEYLASMLGVHRPSVTLVAGKMQEQGLIEYKRGFITVLDRPGLENACCECYGIVRRQFLRLLGQPG
ncbi:Crp/Fnr family transcriptional regulator [Noviherbaspirillum malthae]|uniref:Crp/Fnr family transcriptional regulator n=1 Tax=Noviherbaspirillum malthae TaxID=1260987 RepID=UPI00188F7C10|nr:Crp/Fnr family transcriptional regulator [Noviherbaspirillum malthae]